MLQEWKGYAIAFQLGVPDQHVHHPRGFITHPFGDPPVDAFDLGCDLPSEWLEISALWVVNAVVGRLNGLPRGVGRLNSLGSKRCGQTNHGGQ